MTKFEKLVEGEKLSEAQFFTVIKKGKAKVQVANDLGEMIVLDKEYVEKQLISSTQYSEEKSITKTDAAALFIASSGIALTVNFNKQVDPKESKEQMYDLYANKGGKVLSEADYKKKVDAVLKSIIVGEERTAVGRHYGSINDFGRVHFVDMNKEKKSDKDYDSRLMTVDPRTINWMIIKGVKYKVK